MKIAFHNFLTTLRRYKASSLLNIVGLTLAFTAFYVILVQVRWEMTFNRAIPEAEHIYLVAPLSPFDETGYSTTSPRPEGEQLIAQSPEIEAGGCIRTWHFEQPVWVRRNGDLLRLNGSFNEISAGFAEAMGIKTLEGDLKELAQPNSVALARSQSERLGLHAGDVLWFGDAEKPDPGMQKHVVAVYEDFPANSSFANIVGLQDVGDQDLDSPNNWNDCYFVRLHPDADPEAVAGRWSDFHLSIYRDYLERMAPIWGEEISEEELNDSRACALIPLNDLYFDRRIAALIGAFSGEEADLKAVLRKHRPPKGPVRAGKKTVPDAEPEYWRELFELVRALRKTENSPLFPKGFRSWRRDVAERLLETQNRNGAWGDACGTFYALCAIRLISGFDS